MLLFVSSFSGCFQLIMSLRRCRTLVYIFLFIVCPYRIQSWWAIPWKSKVTASITLPFTFTRQKRLCVWETMLICTRATNVFSVYQKTLYLIACDHGEKFLFCSAIEIRSCDILIYVPFLSRDIFVSTYLCKLFLIILW